MTLYKGDYKSESFGIVRKLDELGRIVIPKEVRKKLGLQHNNLVSFGVDGQTIVLQKFSFDDVCETCGQPLIKEEVEE